MAQSTSDNLKREICTNPKIEWLREISSETINSTSEGFFDSLYDLVVGKEDLIILKPFSIVTDSKESIYFIDQDNKMLIKFSSDENAIESLLDDDIKLKSPVGLCISKNDLVLTDSELNKIYKYSLESEETTILNSTLEQPTGVTFIEELEEYWVCETKKHRIVRLDKDGSVIGTIGQRGNEQGQFNFPTFIWIGINGNVYVNDSMNFRIQVFSKLGQFIMKFGKPGDGSGDIARAKGIATDSFDNVYIVDALFNNVQIFDQSGRLLYSFGEQGTDSGKFWLPTGIFIDDQNKIFIADSFNSRIQIYQLRCEN
jgi:DNA-binding beta-propeller fold protein YncE